MAFGEIFVSSEFGTSYVGKYITFGRWPTQISLQHQAEGSFYAKNELGLFSCFEHNMGLRETDRRVGYKAVVYTVLAHAASVTRVK